MSILKDFEFSPAEIAAQRRVNRSLARAPRLGVVGPVRRALVRTILRLGGIGADSRVRALGLGVETLRVTHQGHALSFRVIRPAGPPRGIVFEIHGGAWVFGSPSLDDLPNVALVRGAGAVVISLDYALALPRPIADLQRESAVALHWLLTAATGELAELPVVVSGESAGSHLVLGALLAARDGGLLGDRVRGALLHCGAYDLGGTESATAAGAEALVLHGPTLAAGIELLLPGLDVEARRAPDLSPLYADLGGLPPTLLTVGDIDPLRDDSIALAAAIERQGGSATLALLPQAPHGIIHLPGSYANRVRAASGAWVASRFDAAA